MKFKFSAVLFVPSDQMYIGGTNKIIFSKEGEAQLENFNDLRNFSKGSCVIYDDRVSISGFDVENEIVKLQGHMESSSEKEIKRLVSLGWKISKEGADHYRIDTSFLEK